MRNVTRKRSMSLGFFIAFALAAVALVLPPLCGDAFGKDRPGKADEPEGAKDKDPVKADEEKPGDFWIDLKGKEGEDLEEAIEEAIREIFDRMEALEKRMDEMTRRMPAMRGMPQLRIRRLPDLRDPEPRKLQPELEELLRELERELPRDWPLEMQEKLRELERDWPRDIERRFEIRRGDEPFEFELKLGPQDMRFSLRMDMEEADDAYVLKLDMPGMDKEDIVVELADNVLTVSGERKERVDEGQEEGEQVRREIVYGSFKRAITLPSDADTEKITSEYDDGVLVITIPKKEGQADEGRRIIVH